MSPAYLFVYGTLRRGSGNRFARVLATQAQFISQARMHGRLYNLGDYPAAVPSDVFADWVRGDVFRLNQAEATLAALDEYEGDLFARVPQPVYLPSGMQLAWVYLYTGKLPLGRRIGSGVWAPRN